MIISFSWTTDAFHAWEKTCTRREWTADYAKRFKVGSVHKAYDRSPRFGGKQIGTIKITSKTYEDIRDAPDSDFEEEGFAYMEKNHILIQNMNPRDFWNTWKKDGGNYWVIRFLRIS